MRLKKKSIYYISELPLSFDEKNDYSINLKNNLINIYYLQISPLWGIVFMKTTLQRMFALFIE